MVDAVSSTLVEAIALDPAVCTRALDARDQRFDGVFFVGITSTRIYCRPICPSRVSVPGHRRFFESAASAELAGFRPCLRCRPELAPGRSPVNAVSRLARNAAQCIEAGALNGHGVGHLAGELGVSERHLRRALERELGVSPLELARTHRLLLAKRLLADTSLSVTRIAYASGFQSLRRFNAVFRERYRLSPSAIRRPARQMREPGRPQSDVSTGADLVRLTLAYRPPMAWESLLEMLRSESLPGVDQVEEGRYRRTVRIGDRLGVVCAADCGVGSARPGNQIEVDVSTSLLPVLMPLLARIRHLFDLDAQPALVDQHLTQSGLGDLVRQRPGLRIPGAMDGFELALRVLLQDAGVTTCGDGLAVRVVERLGDPIATGLPGLRRLSPTAERVAEAGVDGLLGLGVSNAAAAPLAALAREVASGRLRLEPHRDVSATQNALLAIGGMSRRWATAIVMRALYWPDAFDAGDPLLQSGLGAPAASGWSHGADQWRPWRGYAQLHLRLSHSATAPPPSCDRENSTRADPQAPVALP
jgi:AraC family transcriptional regulator, regulatory protein of adaptative response / DNA-3-methyladenine glycosylase II